MAFSQTDLSKTDQRIAEARDRLARQREIVQRLMQGGHDTSDAEALLTIMQGTVEVLEEDRRMIEDEVFSAKAPGG